MVAMMKTVNRLLKNTAPPIFIIVLFGSMALTGVYADSLERDELIALARLEYLIGLATEQRITAELVRYRNSEEASADVISLYETYLDRVRRLTAEKRHLLEQLEGEAGAQPLPSNPSPTTSDDPSGSAYDPRIPEEHELDGVADLEAELDRSLAAYDEMILQEFELSRVESELKMQNLAREAARAAKSLKEQGQMRGSEGADTGLKEGRSSDGAGDETGDMKDDREGEHQQSEGDTGRKDSSASQESSGEGRDMTRADNSQSRGAANGDRNISDDDEADYQDDDIVARQLREAAEKETDPDLKEKLWKEYRDYKKSL